MTNTLQALSVRTNSSSMTLSNSSPPPILLKKCGNDLLSFSCYFLLLRDEAHLIPPVVISLVQLQNSGTLEAVHDVDFSLDVSPADKFKSFFLISRPANYVYDV